MYEQRRLWQVYLHICTGSTESSLLNTATSTKIKKALSLVFCIHFVYFGRKISVSYRNNIWSSMHGDKSGVFSDKCSMKNVLIRRLFYASPKVKVSNGAKIRNRYNQVPHLTQDTNGKVTNSQKTPQTRAKRSALSQQVTKKHI